MPTPDELIQRLFKGLRPAKPTDKALTPEEIRPLLSEIAAAPPKELIPALSRIEGELIDKVSDVNPLRVLAEQFAAHGERGARLAFAKCAALQGASKPQGGEQPGAGAAAAAALAGDLELLQTLKVEKGGFPQVLVDGLFWNGVFTTRGKYNDPPPAHDPSAQLAWCAAVARSQNPSLMVASVRAGAAALSRFPPVARKPSGSNPKDDPFGLKAAAAENDRIRACKRSAFEGLLGILEADPGPALDELRAGGRDEVPAIVKAAVDLEDDTALEQLARVMRSYCPLVPPGVSPQERAAFLRTNCDDVRGERMGYLAGAIDRAFAELKQDLKRKAKTYSRFALASLARKGAGSTLSSLGGETTDPIVASLEKRFLEKAGAAEEEGGKSGAHPKTGAKSGPVAKPSGMLGMFGGSSKEAAAAKLAQSGLMAKPALAQKPAAGGKAGAATVGAPPPQDPVSRSAIADLVRPREQKDAFAGASIIGEKGLAEALGAQQAERFRAAYLRAFEQGSAVAMVGGGQGA